MTRPASGLGQIQYHTFWAAPLGPDSLVVDFGASLAGFSREVQALTGCRCHAVEATPDNVGRIAAGPRLTPHHFAVAGHSGSVGLRIAAEDFHWGAIAELGGVSFEDGVTQVPAITLDDFLRHIDAGRIDLLKVDIEGAELPMFEAAGDAALQSCDQITVEFHDFLDAGHRPAIARIMTRLERLGFAAIVFTRHHHGDVLFLNRARLDLPWWRLAWWRYGVKYGRGLRRILDRLRRRPT